MKQKIKITLLHLLISTLLISLLAGITIIHFYPSVFLDIEEASYALKILVPVDIVLGPLLTFIIYKKDKWGLKFDLAVIGICQLAAIFYGCWAIYSARPGFLVFYGDTFYIAPPSIDQSALENSPLYLEKHDSPKVIYLDLPDDTAKQLEMAMASFSSGIPLQWQTEFFQPFDKVSAAELEKASLTIDNMMQKAGKQAQADLQELQHSGQPYAYIPVVGSRRSQILAVNTETLQPEHVLDIYPY